MSDNTGPTGPDFEPAVVVVCMLAGALAAVGLDVEPQVNEAGRWTNVLELRWALGNFSITVEPLERPLITCLRCGATSRNTTDVAEGYCGHCHDWTSPARPAGS